MSSQSEFTPMGPWTGTTEDISVSVSDIDSRLTRTHYFDGRLLTAEDLSRDQVYLDQRLRELGRAHGSGVVRGLDCTLDAGRIQVASGMALARSGRLLELAEAHTVDLNNAALIASLNNGKYQHLNRGLYMLVLNYGEEQQQLAEVFPSDLASKRETRPNVYAEGVYLSLVSLPLALQQDDEFAVREALIWLLADSLAAVPEEGVALGVVAIADDRPLWFDAQLMRHPLRNGLNPVQRNSDLGRRHQALFNDIVSARRDAGYQNRFSASEYFTSLPPVGPLPKASVRPELGTQNYFPDSFRVTVAPLNRADIAAVREESMALQPLQLHTAQLQEVMILAPLDDADYAYFAQLLETESLDDDDAIEIPIIKPVTLGMQASLAAATADPNWQALWERVAEQDLFFVRRPGRAAETGVSAIVLARGSQLPPASTGEDAAESPAPPTTPTDAPAVVPENQVVLRHINLERLALHRPPASVHEKNAFAKLRENIDTDAKAVLIVNDLLLRIPRTYDAAIWRTLSRSILETGATGLLEFLIREQAPDSSTPKLILTAAEQGLIPMSTAVSKFWTDALENEGRA